MNDNETWRAVPGYEGLYEVSSLGRVKSLAREIIYQNKHRSGTSALPVREKILKGRTEKGYTTVKLVRDGVYYHVGVHRVVCLAFHGPVEGDIEAAHINGDKTDNTVANLVWATPAENARHRRGHGTQIMGEMAPNSKLTNEHVMAARALLSVGWSPERLANLFGVNPSTMNRIKNGEAWSHVA